MATRCWLRSLPKTVPDDHRGWTQSQHRHHPVPWNFCFQPRNVWSTATPTSSPFCHPTEHHGFLTKAVFNVADDTIYPSDGCAFVVWDYLREDPCQKRVFLQSDALSELCAMARALPTSRKALWTQTLVRSLILPSSQSQHSKPSSSAWSS